MPIATNLVVAGSFACWPAQSRSILGDSLKFQGARQEEWYAAKVTLTPSSGPMQADCLIEDCGAPQYIKKTAKMIYKIEAKTLTIAGNEPGDEAVPTGFERNASSRARVFAFTRR